MINLPELPVLASKQGAVVDHFLGIVHVLMAVLFVGWLVFFTLALVRFRRGRHPIANHQGARAHFAKYIEIAVAVAEGVLLVAFSIPIWARTVDKFPPENQATVVQVIAQQFAWNIRYAGPDGVFGRQNPKWVTADNLLGVDPADPAAKDDVLTLNQMYVPVNKPVIVQLSSMDVIHSFAVKAMRVDQDAIPGTRIPLWFEPTRPGDYEINCAQLCGNGHYRMRGFLLVVTQPEFDQWLKQKSKSPASAAGYE
jgi:cytochrome c oxidase subunit II